MDQNTTNATNSGGDAVGQTQDGFQQYGCIVNLVALSI